MRSINLQAKDYCYHYKIADAIYQSDTKFKILEPVLHQPLTDFQSGAFVFLKAEQIYNETTTIGENRYQLVVQTDSNCVYQIQTNSQKYSVTTKGIKANLEAIDETVLMGPVLIVHLAINKVFCLHASAFIIHNTAFILMAHSGTGKSTIAKYINNQSEGLRVADDILPIKIVDNNITILPNFPQLKLTENEQYKGEDICKKTVLLFAEKSNTETSITSIDGFTTTKKLIQHSVATKLFASNELKNHLELCNQIGKQTKSYNVKYQHTEDSLQQLYQLLYELC